MENNNYILKENSKPRNFIINHIKNKNNKPIGTFIALKTDNGVCFGYSCCMTKKETFNKKKGVEIASSRAIKRNIHVTEKDSEIPFKIRDYFKTFKDRSEKYFKEPFVNTIEDKGENICI